ncbi:MAG: hypothetical protein ACKO2P_15495 [Planctomycetota bacterium]
MNTACSLETTAPNQQRWVILRHDFPWLHWDLLLARPGIPAATTWRLLRRPCCNEPIAAQALPDHRLVYLDYEGPVSGGRGRVEQVDGGDWQELVPRDDSQAAAAGSAVPCTRVLLRVQFCGSSHFSTGVLTCTPDGRLFWTLTAVLPDVVDEDQSPLVPTKNSC